MPKGIDLTKKDVQNIEYLLKSGIPEEAIAEIMGLSKKTVERVRDKKQTLQLKQQKKEKEIISHEQLKFTYEDSKPIGSVVKKEVIEDGVKLTILLDELESTKRRLQHLLQSDFIASFDEWNPKSHTYKRDIESADYIAISILNQISESMLSYHKIIKGEKNNEI